MTTREFLGNVTIILTVMAVGAMLEILVPMFADKPWKRGRRSANLGLTALSFLSNWLMASVAAIAALSFRPAGLLAQRGVPFWAEVVIGTFTPSERATDVRYGLDDAAEMGCASFAGLVVMPFQRTGSKSNDKRVSAEVTVGR